MDQMIADRALWHWGVDILDWEDRPRIWIDTMSKWCEYWETNKEMGWNELQQFRRLLRLREKYPEHMKPE